MKRSVSGYAAFIVCALATLLFIQGRALSQPTFDVRYTFGVPVANPDGMQPKGNLVLGTDGNYYGTTQDGGTAGWGTVFKLTPSGVETILHSFGDGSVSNDGAFPVGGLVEGSDDNFYGLTSLGGFAVGTAYKISPGGQVTILHSFDDGSVTNDGYYPLAGLILGSDGNFYGTTEGGGASNSYIYSGTVFKMTPSGTVTILHSFHDGSVTDDGSNPLCALVEDASGNFYGTTSKGGSAGLGTVFEVSSTEQVTILHSFGDGSVTNDGSDPQSGLAAGTDGNYYGTTSTGGSSQLGAAYKVTPTGTVTILHSFGGSAASDGANPDSALLPGSGNVFYGTAAQGGAGSGVVFKMTAAGAVTILHSFRDGTTADDGSRPSTALILGSNGSLYGTLPDGGSNGDGAVYSITVAGAYSLIHTFVCRVVPNDGNGPYAALYQASDGSFYGTTEFGGSDDGGTVFRLSSTGQITILHSFGDGSVENDGLGPDAPLILASDGNLYSTTTSGGSANEGTIYRVTPAGVVTILHSFGDGSVANDGSEPKVGLVQGSDGNLYGTTWGGGADGNGTIFKVTLAGSFTLVHAFGSVSNDGAIANGRMLAASDGNMYGTTAGGGNGNGIVFKLTTAGVYSILYSFPNGSSANEPLSPSGPLVEGSDGNYYGTTEVTSGTSNGGGLYRITPAGQVTVVYLFGSGNKSNDGSDPQGGVIQGSDGSFYGTTPSGGAGSSYGTAFQISPTGTETILHSFGVGPPFPGGLNPYSALVQGSDGNYYGTTSNSMAPTFGGTVFELQTVPTVLWQNNTSGDVYLWNMIYSAGQYQLSSYPKVATVTPTSWKIVGTADIANDGIQDLLWRNSETGQVYYWLMTNGTGGYQMSGYHYLTTVADTDFDIAAMPVVKSGSAPSLLWQNSANGVVADWPMSFTGGAFTLPGTYSPLLPTAGSEWRIAATADINGDGVPDIIWQNSQTGDIYYWLMAVNEASGWHMQSFAKLGNLSGSWRLVRAADINEDGVPDLLWRNTITGDVYYWLMKYSPTNGYALSSYKKLTNIPASWSIVGFGN